MKKLLIASAALAMVAGTVQAQSSVTVYGIMDIGVSDASIKQSVAGVQANKATRTSTGNGDGALSTSRLGFRGTEDLGGGNKANFVLEYDLNDVGAGGGSTGTRYSWVGLESQSLGQLRLGRQEASAHSVVVSGSAGGANNVAGAVYSGNQTPDMANNVSARPHAVFVDKTITYISPKMGGVTAEVQMGKLKDKVSGFNTTDAAALGNAQNGSSTGTIYGASLKYAAGKLALAYGYQEIKRDDGLVGSTTMAAASAAGTDNETAKTTAHMFAANYNFGVVKLFGLYSQQKFDETNKLTAARLDNAKMKSTEIGIQAPVGKAVLWASMFDGSDKNTTNPALPVDFDMKGYQAGVRYDLSKRTSLYAIYGTQEAKSSGILAAANIKNQATGTAVGVRHSF
jgi:predicted porin